MTDVSCGSSDEAMGVDGSCKQMLSSSHECNGPALSNQISVSSPVHCRHLDKTTKSMEALSLISIRALIALVLWYLFSFGAIFLNKYVVDMLNAEIIIFCKYFRHFLTSLLLFSSPSALWDLCFLVIIDLIGVLRVEVSLILLILVIWSLKR